MTSESKPIITVAGETGPFKSIESRLVSGLPSEAVEWRRSFGRASKIVFVNAKFVDFDPDSLTNRSPCDSLLNTPILHTFWAECSDVDTYKISVKDRINHWLSSLKRVGVSANWMVIFVEPPDSRKGNKLLPRTSVIDKAKNEIGGKQPERCISLIDPSKTDSRALESWQGLLYRMRTRVLLAYDQVLGRFEDNMRKQREQRNDAKWHFCNYFVLQEELAFVYEMLGVFDESLVQYDELDALFTQFILNANLGDTPIWLKSLAGEFTDWSGLSLNISINHELRESIKNRSSSILDIRNYLFSRQCTMLLLLNEPWEVAKRSLDFLHNCVQELKMLKIKCSPGSVACWVLLSCLEILSICHNEANSLYTASLWNYARQKLKELGKLCCLFPESEGNDEKLTVDQITRGIKDSRYWQSSNPPRPNPLDKLKEALSSKESFQKYYLELSELAISTFKHIGRIRSARLIGLDLAKYYLELNQTHQASTFLHDALKNFHTEGWECLSKETLMQLVECYRSLKDPERYLRSCAMLACLKVASKNERTKYFSALQELDDSEDSTILTDAEGIFSVYSCTIRPTKTKIIPGMILDLDLELWNNFDSTLTAKDVSIVLTYSESHGKKERQKIAKSFSSASTSYSKNRTGINRSSSTASSALSVSLNKKRDISQEVDDKPPSDSLDLVEEIDYEKDKSIISARLVCRNVSHILKRKDSSGSILKDGALMRKNESDCSFNIKNVCLQPGKNLISLKMKVPSRIGTYTCKMLLIALKKIEFLTDIKANEFFQSVFEEPEVSIVPDVKMLTGCEQPVTMIVECGSNYWGMNNCIALDCSSNLLVGIPDSEKVAQNITVDLPPCQPFEVLKIPLIMISNPRVLTSVQHQVTITHQRKIEEKIKNEGCKTLSFNFDPPFIIAEHSIKTAKTRKFICICIMGSDRTFKLTDLLLKPSNTDVTGLALIDLNQTDDIEVNSQLYCNFLWELIDENQEWDGSSLELCLEIYYKSDEEKLRVVSKDINNYLVNITFRGLKTLYLVTSRVDPNEGEFIQTSTMCSLIVLIEQTNSSPGISIMYEVIVEQGEWAVFGHEAGVLNVEPFTKHTITVEVMPLIGGQLTIPHIRLSKYIPADQAKGHSDSKSTQSRLEPFSVGQVYNINRFDQVQVFMPSIANTGALNTPSTNLASLD